MEQYRKQDPYNSFLSYMYDNSKEIGFLQSVTLFEYGIAETGSANSLIEAWTGFSRDALIGEYAESKLTCWEGHYQQLGCLMFHLFDVVRRKTEYADAKRFSKVQLDFFPDKEFSELLVEGPNGSEERIFYRCWFGLIGHPDFQASPLDSPEAHTYAYWTYVFASLAIDLGRTLDVKKDRFLKPIGA